MANFEAFSSRRMSDPGQVLPVSPPASAASSRKSGSEVDGSPVSLRVYVSNAIMSPGTLYKAVVATPRTTALEVVASVLERYGEKEDASEFELHLVRVDEKSGKVKRQGSFARLIPGQAAEKFCVVLADDVCPVLVADWHANESRRFELHRRTSAGGSPTSKGSSPRKGALFGSLRRKKDSTRMTAFQPDVPAVSETFSDDASNEASSEGGAAKRDSDEVSQSSGHRRGSVISASGTSIDAGLSRPTSATLQAVGGRPALTQRPAARYESLL